MLQVVDENAVTASRPFKFGTGDGLRGIKDTTRSAFAKPPTATSKATMQPKARTALGDLTNSIKGTSFSYAKPAQASARTVSEPPVEESAGKGWQALEKELQQQAERELQQRLDRIAAASRSWTTSHLYHEELSSDDESDSEGYLQERFVESPLIVHLLAPRHAQDVITPQPGSGFDTELYNLLPEVTRGPIGMEFCWSEEDE